MPSTPSSYLILPSAKDIVDRRSAIYEASIRALDSCFSLDKAGVFEDTFVDADPTSPDKRCRYGMAFAYLSGTPEQQKKGVALITQTPLETFDNHAVSILTILATKFADRIPADAMEIVRDLITRYAAEAGTADFRVQGFNDNAPMHCITTLLLAGQLLENASLHDLGKLHLQQGVDMLLRRRCFGEMNSPTYSQFSLTPMAHLAELSSDPEVRKMAGLIRDSLFTEILMFHHRELGVGCAPFSRAYSDDVDLHVTDVQLLLHFIFGETTPWRMADILEPDPRLRTHGTFQYSTALMPYRASANYPLNPKLLEILKNAEYPLEIHGLCENGTLGGSHVNSMPAGASPFTSYRTATLALGSFRTRSWPEKYLHAAYLRRPIPPGAQGVEAAACVNALYYTFHSTDVPLYATPRTREMDRSDRIRFTGTSPHSSAVIVQDRARAIVSGCVRLPAGKSTTTVAMRVIVPGFFSRLDDVFAGTQRLGGGVGTFDHYPRLNLRDGGTYIRIIPLVNPENNYNQMRAASCEIIENYQAFSFYNVTSFSPLISSAEKSWHNGFYIEFGSPEEDGSFEEFCAVTHEFVVHDHLHNGRERVVKISGPRPAMEFAADTFACTLRYATVNKQVLAEERLTTSSKALNDYLNALYLPFEK